MNLRKCEDTGIERGSTRSHTVENSLWQRLWTCRKADYGSGSQTFLVHGALRISAIFYGTPWSKEIPNISTY